MALPAETEELAKDLHDIVAMMIGRDLRDERSFYDRSRPPIDVEPENFHANMREFREELRFVKEWIGQFERFEAFLKRDEGSTSEYEERRDLAGFIDGWARSDSKYEEPQTAQELAVSNVMRVGLSACFLMLNEKLGALLKSRLEQLERQEKEFWSVDHRPPNYHARTIALRLAQLYARKTQTLPTTGTSGLTGEPSTRYASALKSVFQRLSLSADFKTFGEWAVSQISEDDFKPSQGEESQEVLRQIEEAGYLKSRVPKDLNDL